jgi:hypothetical protein
MQVFLCHASDDKARVIELYDRLEAAAFDPWIDQRKLHGGQDWDFEIKRAVRRSDVVIVCLSPRSITKEGYVQKEIRQALDIADEKPQDHVYIIPVRLEECDVPETLRRWQRVDLYAEDGFERLLMSLRDAQRKRASTLAAREGNSRIPRTQERDATPVAHVQLPQLKRLQQLATTVKVTVKTSGVIKASHTDVRIPVEVHCRSLARAERAVTFRIDDYDGVSFEVVPGDYTIYVSGEVKGMLDPTIVTRGGPARFFARARSLPWTGRLSAGSYQFECAMRPPPSQGSALRTTGEIAREVAAAFLPIPGEVVSLVLPPPVYVPWPELNPTEV